MELTKTHREALLNELNETNEAIESRKSVIESFKKKKDEQMAEWSSMSLFLLEKKRELIEQSLIDNEIDW